MKGLIPFQRRLQQRDLPFALYFLGFGILLGPPVAISLEELRHLINSFLQLYLYLEFELKFVKHTRYLCCGMRRVRLD